MNRVWKFAILALLALPFALAGSVTDLLAKDNDAQEKIYKQISIMEKIIDEAMVESKNALVQSTHPSRGVYLEGYGPVFTLELGLVNEEFQLQKLSKLLDFGSGYTISREEEDEDGEVTITIKKKKGGDGEKEVFEAGPTPEERYQLVKKELIEVVRDYGYTIDRAGSDEWLTIFATPLAGLWADKDIDRLILRVQMKDIRAYNSGKMNEKQFAEKVEVIET